MQKLLPFRWLALALLLLLAWDASPLDLWTMRQVGTTSGFALHDAWVTRGLIHGGGRAVSYVAMGFLVLLNLWPGLLPVRFTRVLLHESGPLVSRLTKGLIALLNMGPRLLPALTRRERTWWLLTTLVCLVGISLLKRASLTSCPYDLADFGGRASYVSHWVFGVRDGGGGHCFPSGHASAAFAFLAGGWALARAYPAAARAWLATVLALGIVYGVGQMLRGAHYPSHTMWTGWICWALTVVAARLGPWRLRRDGP